MGLGPPHPDGHGRASRGRALRESTQLSAAWADGSCFCWPEPLPDALWSHEGQWARQPPAARTSRFCTGRRKQNRLSLASVQRPLSEFILTSESIRCTESSLALTCSLGHYASDQSRKWHHLGATVPLETPRLASIWILPGFCRQPGACTSCGHVAQGTRPRSVLWVGGVPAAPLSLP